MNFIACKLMNTLCGHINITRLLSVQLAQDVTLEFSRTHPTINLSGLSSWLCRSQGMSVAKKLDAIKLKAQL